MAQAWPVTLPQSPLLEGMSYQRENNRDSFKPRTGPALVGPITTDAGAFCVFPFYMTRAQVDILEAFYETTLLFGSINILMTDPITETIEEFQLSPDWTPNYIPVTPDLFRVVLELYRLP